MGVLSAFSNFEHPTVAREALADFERSVKLFIEGVHLYVEAHAGIAERAGLDPDAARRNAQRRIRQMLIDGRVITE
jgi:hypothetical protein